MVKEMDETGHSGEQVVVDVDEGNAAQIQGIVDAADGLLIVAEREVGGQCTMINLGFTDLGLYSTIVETMVAKPHIREAVEVWLANKRVKKNAEE
jgi:hypothetical protein